MIRHVTFGYLISWWALVYLRTKFGANILLCGWDIQRKRNSKWRPLAVGFYFRFSFWWHGRLQSPTMHLLTKFDRNRTMVAELLWFDQCSRWPPSAILDLYLCMLDHPRRWFGLKRLTKFGICIMTISLSNGP